MTGTTEEAARRNYARRSDEQRIKDLEAKIAEIREREEEKQRKENPLLKEVPKLQAKLRGFAKLATKNGRLDIANSVTAWVSSLDRMTRDERLRPAKLDLDDDEGTGEA